ncbi:MAG: hypothetical protein MJ238_06675 [Bacilli bacterium]|nr:hypothetical protein [Bacilli bacterium]
MNSFNQGAINYLEEGDKKYYVYALVDGEKNEVFYIGKGEGNRVFSHQIEAGKDLNSEREKLKRINKIEESGKEVKKYLLNWHLTEEEAFAAESALINLMKILGSLTNIVSGHGDSHEAFSVEDFDLLYGAKELTKADITDNLVAFKINGLYKHGMSAQEIYDSVRGYWKVNIQRASKCKYVVALYNDIIVGVYKNIVWHDKNNWNGNPKRPNNIDTINKQSGRKFFTADICPISNKYYGKSIKENFVVRYERTPIKYIEK